MDVVRVVPPYARLASEYDAALGMRDFHRTRRAFEHLIRRHRIRFRSVVDLGCGTGLFARYLARCWRACVFGVDKSPAMLAIACRRARGAPIHLLRQDLRSLKLPCRVDLATANFDTLNHVTGAGDLRRAFIRVADVLEPGGHFIFDLITPCRPLGGARRFVRVVHTVARRIVQRIAWDPIRNRIRIQVIVSDPGGSTIEQHRERAWDPADVSRWLDETGFVIRGVYDAATLRVATRCPPRILVVAERRRSARSPRP